MSTLPQGDLPGIDGESDDLKKIKEQNAMLHDQVKRLMATERALLETNISHSYRVKHIHLVNDFALSSSRVDTVHEVFDLAEKLLLNAYAFDLVAALDVKDSYLTDLKYRLRSSKKPAHFDLSEPITFDLNQEIYQKTTMYFRDETGIGVALLYTLLTRRILEEEEEDEGFDIAHKVLVTLPLRRRTGELVGMLFAFAAAPDLKFATELTLGQVPTLNDLAYLSLANSHTEAAVEKLILIQESHAKGIEQAEMEATKSIQERLLPHSALPPPGVDVVSHYRPATTAGGDWYGYSYDREYHTLNIYIGDVTGHGVSSSIITGVACGAIYGAEAVSAYLGQNSHSQSDTPNPSQRKDRIEEKLKGIVHAINSVLYHTGRPNKLMTMAFISLELDTGELTYINCGHPPLFLLTQDKVRGLIMPSPHLGQKATLDIKTKRFQMLPGDTLFTYTDGLVENFGPSGAPLGERKLREMLNSKDDPPNLQNRILQATDAIWGDAVLEDDVTFSIFRWAGPIDQQTFLAQQGAMTEQTLWGIQYAGQTKQQ